ncbi:MAG TPA: CTP synthase [Chloroflexi bacterium]|nr:CTP synthase [Chloroflexota bacterium]|tara:strand:+ start:3338 stop:4963 length:1626 start_codon:yes stop_codon:yes gene_type:complete
MNKYIFVTGGVVSSVGKGIVAAAMGRMLKERGLTLSVQKLDPYLNVDPGTMSPYQHGEVFVTTDGAETDLDLGHYERFIDINLKKVCNVTTGKLYSDIISAERRGDYLGGTIQVIPHITNEIKRHIKLVPVETDSQIVIVEVGGTIGDIESLPFLEALRQLRSELGRENVIYVHVTWLPHIGATNELKTKPTQHSVRELRSIGISPDIIVARADHNIGSDLCEKISRFCDVPVNAVIPVPTTNTTYEVPLLLEKNGLGQHLVGKLHLKEDVKSPNWKEWKTIINSVKSLDNTLKIAIVGKYVELEDAYISVREALHHAGAPLGYKIDIKWVQSSKLEIVNPDSLLNDCDGIVVPGGFGRRGVEGKINASSWARTNQTPYLGLCLGMQVMCIEFAREVLGLTTANSTEFNKSTLDPVIDLMIDQRNISNMGGTMRLGIYPCKLIDSTIASKSYNLQQTNPTINERHRHRFEFNNDYREMFSKNGLLFSGISPDNQLIEIVEISDHPFMLGCQFHPEFLSRPNRPHPLFSEFIKVASTKSQNT